MRKFFVLLALSALALAALCPAAAAGPTLKAESLNFVSADEDLIEKDDTKDAVFTLTVSGAQAIQSITLKNETTGTEWNTSSPRNLLLVQNSRGETINADGRMTPVPVLLMANFTLIINDAEKAIPKDSKFTATVKMIGGEASSVSTEAAAVKAPEKPKKKDKKGAEITLLESKGKSKQDFVGGNEKLASNGKKDYRIDIRFKLPKGVTVEGIKVYASNGSAKAEWDTVRGNGVQLVAVADNSNNIQNKNNGAISLDGNKKYRLFLDDGGNILNKNGTQIKITATLSDGTMIESTAGAAQADASEQEDADVTAKYTGIGKYDFTGQNDKPAANMNPDSFIELSAAPLGTRITGVKVTNSKNGQEWDTIPGNKIPGLVVLSTSASSAPKKLNNDDGSVSIDAGKAQKLLIAFDEEKGHNTGPYKVTLLLEDGRLLEVKAED